MDMPALRTDGERRQRRLVSRNEMTVTVRRPAVGVSGAELDVDQIQCAVPDSALRHDRLGKLAHALDRAFEHHGLHALIVIEVCVHGRHGQVVMSVL